MNTFVLALLVCGQGCRRRTRNPSYDVRDMLLQDGVIVTVYFPVGKKEDVLTKFKYHNMQDDECRSIFANSAREAVGLEDIGCEVHASGRSCVHSRTCSFPQMRRSYQESRHRLGFASDTQVGLLFWDMQQSGAMGGTTKGAVPPKRDARQFLAGRPHALKCPSCESGSRMGV